MFTYLAYAYCATTRKHSQQTITWTTFVTGPVVNNLPDKLKGNAYNLGEG